MTDSTHQTSTSGLPDLRGRKVLITGATQGIGKATAIALGRMGADLVLVCRNEAKARAATADIEAASGGRRVSLIVADLASLAEVRRAAAEFRHAHDRLDVLVNNAGVLVTSRRTTVDGIEETLAINHLAPFLLTTLLLDRLKASGTAATPARVVTVSSEAHRMAKSGMRWEDVQFARGYRSFPAYAQSKLANILFTRELARKLTAEGAHVTANCLHPGVVASGFGQTYGGAMAFFVKLAKPFMVSVEKGAETSVYLASSPEVAGVTGKYFMKCAERRPSRAASSDDDARRLWDVSEGLVGAGAKAGVAA